MDSQKPWRLDQVAGAPACRQWTARNNTPHLGISSAFPPLKCEAGRGGMEESPVLTGVLSVVSRDKGWFKSQL